MKVISTSTPTFSSPLSLSPPTYPMNIRGDTPDFEFERRGREGGKK